MRVSRSQLPNNDEFHPSEQSPTDDWYHHRPDAWDVILCHICGQRGKGKCPNPNLYFCGNHHPKEHSTFLFDKKRLSHDMDVPFLPSVHHGSELVIEDR